MKKAAKILEGFHWDPQTMVMIGEIAQLLEQQGKYLNDLEMWVEMWGQYYREHVSKLLYKKAKNIEKKKMEIEISHSYEQLKKINYIINKESEELTIINGVRIFFSNVIKILTQREELCKQQIEKVENENQFIFYWAETYEKLFNQSSRGETILSELNLKLLRENETLKQQIKKLTNQSK